MKNIKRSKSNINFNNRSQFFHHHHYIQSYHHQQQQKELQEPQIQEQHQQEQSDNSYINLRNGLIFSKAKAFSSLYFKVQAKNKFIAFNNLNLEYNFNGTNSLDPSNGDLSPVAPRTPTSVNFRQSDRILESDGKIENTDRNIEISPFKYCTERHKIHSQSLYTLPILIKPLIPPQNLTNDKKNIFNSQKFKKRAFSINFVPYSLKPLIDESIDEKIFMYDTFHIKNYGNFKKIKHTPMNSNPVVNPNNLEKTMNTQVNKDAKSNKLQPKFRRKSCHCYDCGGISNIELKVMHLPTYIRKYITKNKLNSSKSHLNREKLGSRSTKKKISEAYTFIRTFTMGTSKKLIKEEPNQGIRCGTVNESQKPQALLSSPRHNNNNNNQNSATLKNSNILNLHALNNGQNSFSNSNLMVPSDNNNAVISIQPHSSASLIGIDNSEIDLNPYKNTHSSSLGEIVHTENISDDNEEYLLNKKSQENSLKSYEIRREELEIVMKELPSQESSPPKKHIIKPNNQNYLKKKFKYPKILDIQPLTLSANIPRLITTNINNSNHTISLNDMNNTGNSPLKTSESIYIQDTKGNDSQVFSTNSKIQLNSIERLDSSNIINPKNIEKKSSHKLRGSQTECKNQKYGNMLKKSKFFGDNPYPKKIMEIDVKPYFDKSLVKLTTDSTENFNPSSTKQSKFIFGITSSKQNQEIELLKASMSSPRRIILVNSPTSPKYKRLSNLQKQDNNKNQELDPIIEKKNKMFLSGQNEILTSPSQIIKNGNKLYQSTSTLNRMNNSNSYCESLSPLKSHLITPLSNNNKTIKGLNGIKKRPWITTFGQNNNHLTDRLDIYSKSNQNIDLLHKYSNSNGNITKYNPLSSISSSSNNNKFIIKNIFNKVKINLLNEAK